MCFDNVPEVAWSFHMGGRQPAQKWLKDRKECELSFEDIKRHRKIIKILAETGRVVKTVEVPLG
jgi:Type ISP C-terminal specificity domain